jgi:hypothetical protein
MGEFEVTMAEKMYYVLFMAYTIVDVGFIWTTTETIMMSLHHAATISMIAAVTALRGPGLCMAIMLLHDVCDVPLLTAKVSAYLGLEALKNVSFVVFVLVCTWCRLVNFLLIIITAWGQLSGALYLHWLWRATTLCAMGLYCLHLIWEWKILRIVSITVRGGGVRDTRSD